MNQRENLLRAMRRENPEYIPYHLTMTPYQKEQLLKKTGTSDEVAYFDLCAEFICLQPTKHPNAYDDYHPNLPEGAYIDEWGVGYMPGSVAHFTKMIHPMKDFTDPKEIMDYPYPDRLAEYRWEGMQERIDQIHNEGRAAVFFAIQIFEYAWYLRGLDNLLVDMMVDEEMAVACLNKMTEFQCEFAKSSEL